MGFNIGDKVRVIGTVDKGRVGEIIRVYSDSTHAVRFEDNTFAGFFASELVTFDAKREALIDLAETLDRARRQANAIEETADQFGVYGDVCVALKEVLLLIEGGYKTEAYGHILDDGSTVREALDLVAGGE